MTEQERFHFGYVCGDTGLIDEQAEHQWFIENCCSITDLKKNWKIVCDKLNEINKENEELKQQLADIDKLIYDLGHNEMQRQYEEIIKENVEDDCETMYSYSW